MYKRQVRTELAKLGSDLVVAALPADRLLAAPTLRAQFEAVEANLVLGNPDLLNRESADILVAAMTLPNVLRQMCIRDRPRRRSHRHWFLPPPIAGAKLAL